MHAGRHRHLAEPQPSGNAGTSAVEGGASGSILHVIVGGEPPAPGRTRFRRDRFAEFLAAQPTTAGVFVLNRKKVQRVPVHVWMTEGRPIHYFNLWDYRSILAYGGLLQRMLFRPVLEQARKFDPATRILWYTKPMYAELANALDWDTVVYDCSDFWNGNRHDRNPLARWNAPRQARTEARIIGASDLLLASSSFLVERLRSVFGRTAQLVENGVDVGAFRAATLHSAPDFHGLPRPRLGFVGTLKNKKIALGLIAELAQRHPEWSVVLIGPVHPTTLRDPDYNQLRGLPNLALLGPRPGTEIPAILRELDLALLPYRNAEYNRGVFPLKFFEYLAAGLPVVGCGLPSTLAYVEEGVYHHVEGGAIEFCAACEAALAGNLRRARLMEIADGADWSTKFATMLNAALERVRRPAAPAT
jgi:teichuronic acid biosynthesis glycosyltransferase TuaH